MSVKKSRGLSSIGRTIALYMKRVGVEISAIFHLSTLRVEFLATKLFNKKKSMKKTKHRN
jgi:hypothetical protein